MSTKPIGLSEEEARFAEVARKIGAENTTRLLSRMMRGNDFVTAISSDIGQEILSLIYIDLEKSVGKLVDTPPEPYSDEDALLRAEIRVLKRLVSRITKRIETYVNDLDKWNKHSTAR